MTVRIRLPSIALLSLVAACGGGDDGNNPTVDAFVPLTDSAIDAPPPPPGCDYGELNDVGNDDFTSMTGIPEATNLTFTASTVLCGKIDSGHFQAPMTAGNAGLVDIDSYVVTLADPAEILITISGAGAEALAGVEVDVYTGQGFADFVTAAEFVGNHGVTSVSLPAGTYEFAMLATNLAATTAPIDYKIKIGTDAPLTRCPKVAAAANYTELDPGNTANDVVRIEYGSAGGITLTSNAADSAEASLITVAPATNYRISGTSALVTADGSYLDRDTFSFTTDANTNQLAVRLNWPAAADLDVYVFEAAMIDRTIASGSLIGTAEGEFITFALKPSTSYWVWVGGYVDNTVASTYDISLCGVQFTP